MREVFAYVIGLGAAVMMPVIFTVLGTLIGIKFSKALKSSVNRVRPFYISSTVYA